VVGSGALLQVNGTSSNTTTFNASLGAPNNGNYGNAVIAVNGGGQIQAANSTFGVTSVNLANASYDSIQTSTFTSHIQIDSGANYTSPSGPTISGNTFTNVPNNGVAASGAKGAYIYLENNTWGATPSSQIVDSHSNSNLPTIVYSTPNAGPATQTTAASASAPYSDAGESVTLTANVATSSGTVTEGTVTFTVLQGGVQVGTPVSAAVVNGAATTLTPYVLPGGTPLGAYTIQAVYSDSGGTQYTSSSDSSQTLTVTRDTTSTAAKNVQATYNSAASSVTLTANVASPGVVGSGTVTFTIPTLGNSTVTANVVNGVATASFPVPAGAAFGTYPIDADYTGNASFTNSSDDGGHSLSIVSGTTSTNTGNASLSFSTASQPLTLTASVAAAITVAEGTVDFTITNSSHTVVATQTVNVSNGSASTTSLSLPGGTPVGTYDIHAAYSDATGNFTSSSYDGTLTISRVNTTTAAQSQSVTFSSVQQNVAVSSTVASSAGTVNEGTVTFTILNGGTTIAGPSSPISVSAGSASTTMTLPAGLAQSSYTIKAVYADSAGNLNGSSDNSHTLTVTAPPAATVAVSLDPASNSGAPGHPGYTTVTSPTFDVQVNQPGTITINFDGTHSQSRTVPTAGAYQFTSPPLGDGQYVATATFDAGIAGSPQSNVAYVIDTLAPFITGSSPSGTLNTGVSQVQVTFSEPINLASFTPSTITLSGPSGVIPVNQPQYVSGNTYRITFPQQNRAGAYQLQINTSVTDYAGNPLAQAYSSAFTVALPNLSVVTTSVPSSAVEGAAIPVSWEVANVSSGNPTASTWNDGIYLSSRSNLDGSAIPLKTLASPTTPLTPGTNYSRSTLATLPSNVPAGNYFVLIAADADGGQPVVAGDTGLVVADAISLTAADLQVSGVSGPASGVVGQSVGVSWTDVNNGTAAASSPWVDNVYVVSDAQGDNPVLAGSFTYGGGLAVGGSAAITQQVTLPDTSGPLYFMVATNATRSVGEGSQYGNDSTVAAASISVAPAPLPDLVVSSITPPQSGVLSGTTVPVTYVISNRGQAPTSVPQWQDWVILSQDPNLGATYQGQLNATGPGGDQELATQPIVLGVANASYLNPGDSYQQTVDVTLPIGASGNWYVYVVPDGTGAHHAFGMPEASRADKLSVSSAFSVTLSAPPALTVSNVTAPDQNNSGKSMNVSWTVTNTGTGPTAATSWTDAVYLSATPTLDSNATLLGTFLHQGALAAHAAYSPNVEVNLPVGISGTFYVIVQTDMKGQVFQNGNTSGNVAATSGAETVNLTPPPDLTVSAVTLPATVTAGHSFAFSYKVTNAGAGDTPNTTWTDSLYLSPTPTYDAATAIPFGEEVHQGSLAAHGGSYVNNLTATFPAGLAGIFYLIVNTDSGNVVYELPGVKGDEWGSSSTATTASLTPANLVVTSVSATTPALPGAGIDVSWTVANEGGNDTGVSAWQDSVYATTSNTLDASAQLLGTFIHYGLLAGNGSYQQSQLVTIPIDFLGNYNLFVVADSGQAVYEGTRNTTSAAFPITVSLTAQGQQAAVADLQVTSVTSSPVVNGSVTVDWSVQNIGSGPTNATVWNDDVWASTRPTLRSGGTDIYLGAVPHVNTLAAGDSYSAAGTFTLPGSLVPGNYYFIVDTNQTITPTGDSNGEGNENVYESNTSNNQSSTTSSVSSSAPALPDLTVSNVGVPATAQSGQQFTVTWTVANSGADTSSVPITDSVYLSQTPTFDPTAVRYLGSVTYTGDLAGGGSYNQSASLTIPVGVAGTYYVFVVTNSSNDLPTSSTAGTTAAAANTVLIQLAPPADLAAGTVSIPSSALAGQSVTVTYQVTNIGGNPANGSWYDDLYLSTTPTWSASDTLLGSVYQSRDLLPSQSYTGTLTTAMPGVTPGQYYVIARANVLANFPEVDRTNNVSASATTLAVDAAPLTLGISQAGTLTQDQAAYYKVIVSAGQTLQVAIATQASGAFNELYVSYGTMPTRSQYQYRYSIPFAGNQTVTVPTTQAGTYYILAYANDVPTPPESYSLVAQLVPFGIQSTTPSQVGAGPVTLQIDGAQFTSGLTFQLQNGNGTVNAERVLVQDSATAFATFDLTGQAPGSYSITASEPGQSSVTSNSAITVVPATVNNAVKLGMVVPQDILVGRPGTITITYDNPGNTDLPAPAIFLDSQNVLFQVPGQSGYSTSSLQLFGLNPNGPFGTLTPGFQGSITIPFEPATDGAGITSSFSLQALADPGEPFPWTTIATADVPAGTSPQEWAGMVAQAEGVMGNTWGSVVGFLGTSTVQLLMNQAAQTSPTTADGLYDLAALLQYAVGIYGSASPSASTPSLPVVATQGQATLYNGNLDGSGNPVPLDGTYPTFVIVPGFGGYQAGDASLAAAIAADTARYPGGHVNILIANWTGAAAGPTIDGETVPWESATNIVSAGRDLGTLLSQLNQQGEVTFSTTTVIGQGSGNDVAEQAAQLVGGLSGIIALNPEAAFGGFVPLNLTTYFQSSVAYETNSLFGLQGAIAASNQTLPTGDLNDPVATQALGITWLLQQVLSGNDGILDPSMSGGPDAIPAANAPSLPFPGTLVIDTAEVLQITSVDPDSMIGPKGSGTNGLVPISSPLPYTITFTNTPSTPAPAQQVVITQKIDPPNLNWESFQLTGFGFDGVTYTIPNGPATYSTTLAFNGYNVQFYANIDESTGLASWKFTTIDPTTGKVPLSATIGLLPPNDASGDGEGFVSYVIMPNPVDPTGTQITSQATVTFDTQPPLQTNEAINTVDAGSALTSSVQPLPAIENHTQFNVTWSGSGNASGSGIHSYTIYVSDNGGAYSPWLQNTQLTTAVFTGQFGHAYNFYSVATDNVGDIQPTATSAQATTKLVALPAVTGLSSSSGPAAGGGVVTINGSNFTGTTGVSFGSYQASSFTVLSDSQITVTVPAGLAGSVDVTVTTPGGTSARNAADHFTYIAAPSIGGVSPASGPTTSGTVVTITGTGFTGTSAVNFGSSPAVRFTVVSDTRITATAPAGSPGSVDVTVTSVGGTSSKSSADRFSYVAAPSVTGLDVSSGPLSGGTVVAITGTGFTGATYVGFGSNAAASFTVVSDTRITATAPAGTAGIVDITVTTVGGTSGTSTADHFTYVAAPSVTGVGPAAGPTASGTVVAITGTGFTGASAVNFGSNPAVSFNIISDTQITATAPAGSAGIVDVTVTTVGGTSAASAPDHFAYVAAPSVTGVGPAAGPTSSGTVVTITGTGFTGASSVSFGSNPAVSYTVDSDTQITATAPAGSAGSVDITVTTVGGTSTATAADHFTYIAAPSVTGVGPAAGPTSSGTLVTITGIGFTGASAVSFGSNAAVSFNIVSDTKITASAPAGSAGTVDITVTTVGGTSTTSTADHFTYVAAPSVTGLDVSSGPLSGGTVVTITGSGFTGASAVAFGSTPAASYTVDSDTEITATASAEAAGTVDITVTTIGGTSARSNSDLFTYLAPPSVTLVSPSSGLLAGGTTVTIAGSNFSSDTSVLFGSAPASNVTVVNSGEVLATAPAEANMPSTVDVAVTTAGGTSTTTTADEFSYASADTSFVNLSSGSVTLGGTITVTLQAEDAGGQALSTGGLSVAFALTGSAQGAFGSVTDHGDGTYSATFTPSAIGSGTITATIDGQTLTTAAPAITVNPYPVSLSRSVVTVSPGSVQAGSQATITLQARDASGNNLPAGGLTVAFALAASAGATGTFSPVTDNNNGTYTATFTGKLAGSNSITATINGQPVTSAAPTIAVTPGSVSPSSSVLSLSLPSIQFGGSTTVDLLPEDAYGNVVTSPVTVGFGLGSTGNTSAKGTFGPITHNADGSYSTSFTGTADGSNTITATINSAAVTSASPSVQVSLDTFSAATSFVALGSPTVQSGTTTLVTLQAEDAKGVKETAGGLKVSFSLGSTTGGKGTFSSVTDNDNGTYTATFTGALVGKNTIVAAINGTRLTSKAAAITVTAGQLSLARSPITLSSSTARAGTPVTVTFQPEDAAGNKLTVTGLNVVFGLGSGTGSGTFGAVKFSNGTYTATFTPTTVGTNTITATVGGSAVASTPAIAITAGTASTAKSLVIAGSSPVQSGSSTTVTLQAIDAFGNAETSGGLVVAFKLANTTGGQGTFGKVTDNKNGTYTATFTGTLVGTNTITTTIGGTKVASTAPVAIIPGAVSPTKSTLKVSSATVAVNGTVTVTLQAKDAAGNNETTGGAVVVFLLESSTGGEGSFGPVTDNGNGTYSTTFMGTAAGKNTIQARINGQLVTSVAGITIA
jgi:hypothetical protein